MPRLAETHPRRRRAGCNLNSTPTLHLLYIPPLSFSLVLILIFRAFHLLPVHTLKKDSTASLEARALL
jgi:hypothetical protein